MTTFPIPADCPLTDAQYTRVQEVFDEANIKQLFMDDVDTAFACLSIDEESARNRGLYSMLVIDPQGRIACYDVNQPVYHLSFRHLAQAN